MHCTEDLKNKSAQTSAGGDKPTCPAKNILPSIAGKSVFGLELRRLRELSHLSRAELSRKANVNYSRLGAWEYGVFLPTKNMRVEAEALDRLLSADGKLTALWLESTPAQESLAAKIYRLPEQAWPKRLRDQWQSLVAYSIRLIFEQTEASQNCNRQPLPWVMAFWGACLRFVFGTSGAA